jgi:hypothetical protein
MMSAPREQRARLAQEQGEEAAVRAGVLRASSTAAASPFGPEPTTTASSML